MSTFAKNAIASIALVTVASHAGAEGTPITEAMKPVMAATRIFALENHLRGDIAVADEDEGHIGQRFEVNHVPGQKCSFTMRHRDGPVIETISFDRLSAEYHVSPRDGYALLSVAGRPGAQCEISGTSKKCSSSLDMLLMVEGSPSELDLARRALSYIFSNVCAPAQLPF
jgi:hypothetical protein